MLVHWQKDFELGRPAADAEHREVVDLLNELDVCVATGGPPPVIDRALDSLTATLARHFAQERIAPHPVLERARQLQQAWHADAASPQRDELRSLAHWWLIHLCCHAHGQPDKVSL